MGTVEAEAARLDLGKVRVAIGTAEVKGKRLLVPARCGFDQDEYGAAGKFERQVDALGQPGPDAGPDRDPVDDGLDRMGFGLDEFRRRFGHFHHFAVNPCPDQASTANGLKDVEVLPFAGADQRGQDLHLFPSAAHQYAVDHLLGRLAMNRRVAGRTVRRAGPREQEPQVIVDLGDGPERAARIGRTRPLVNRDDGRQPLDRVDIRRSSWSRN